MRKATAFSPCHITGFFQILDRPADPIYAGSRGAGVSLSKGVETIVKISKALKSSLQVKVNGFDSNATEVSKHVVAMFCSQFKEMRTFKISVEHHVEVPTGAGFGTSGAAALSLALALNDAFGLGISKIEAAQIAHVAEVECKTGLGTVIAEAIGGLEIRVKHGAPGIGEVRHVPVAKDHVMACLTFGPLSTKKSLADADIRRRINEFGGELVDKLVEEPNVTAFLKFSRQFAEHVGLITEKTRRTLNATDEAQFVCSMPMFGESAFTLVEEDSLEKLLKIFHNDSSDGRIIVSGIDFEGARLLK
jgi:pantoate kinase